jgi:hypothetical protein
VSAVVLRDVSETVLGMTSTPTVAPAGAAQPHNRVRVGYPGVSTRGQEVSMDTARSSSSVPGPPATWPRSSSSSAASFCRIGAALVDPEHGDLVERDPAKTAKPFDVMPAWR